MKFSILVVTNNPTAAVYTQIKGLLQLGVNVHTLFFEREHYGKLVYFGANRKIRKAAKEYNADIVHLQFGGILALQTLRAGIDRTVLTFHGTDLHGGNPKGFLQKISYKMGVWSSRWAARRASWNIVVSPTLLPYISDITNNVSVIPTGVDYELFYPIPIKEAKEKLGLDQKKIYVLFCDYTHDHIKRQDLANASLYHVKKIIPEIEILKIHRVPHGMVPLYLNSSSCLLITSDKEGSPNIVKEAIACNVPIVSVDVGDVAILIKGIHNCYIVDRNIEAISEKIVQVIEDGKHTDGREKAKNIIENTIVCKKVLNIYDQVLKNISIE